MKAFFNERANELEEMLNWVNDQDRQWWPFVFLRPEPREKMGSLRVAVLSLLLGIFFGMLVNVALALMPMTSQTRPHVFVFPFAATLGFFVFYRTTFAYSWNRRAARIAGRSAR